MRITWLKLLTKIGKQRVNKIKNKTVEVEIDGKLYPVELVYTNSGYNFHLKAIK